MTSGGEGGRELIVFKKILTLLNYYYIIQRPFVMVIKTFLSTKAILLVILTSQEASRILEEFICLPGTSCNGTSKSTCLNQQTTNSADLHQIVFETIYFISECVNMCMYFE